MAAGVKPLAVSRESDDRLARDVTASRMDVVFFAPYVGALIGSKRSLLAGGAETQIVLLTSALAAAGYRVGIVVFGTRAELPTEVNGVRIIPHTPPPGSPTALQSVRHAGRTLRMLKRIETDAFVQRTAGAATGIVGAAARLGGVRFVFSSSGLADFRFPARAGIVRRVLAFRVGVRLAEAI